MRADILAGDRWLPVLAAAHHALGDQPGAIARDTITVDDVTFWVNEVIGTAPAAHLRPLGPHAAPFTDRRHALAAGALQVRSLEQFDPDIRRLCDHLSDAVGGRPVNCNLFVSDAGAPPALNAHYDCLDVIAVGLAGEKTWQLWPGDARDPLTVTEDAFVENQGRTLACDHQLGAGDVMAIQRGTPHMARMASSGPAVHLAIGVAADRQTGRWQINNDGTTSPADPTSICDHQYVHAPDASRQTDHRHRPTSPPDHCRPAADRTPHQPADRQRAETQRT